MGNKLTPAQKQTKLRSGIQPMQIMIFTNYLAKPQFPLTSDLFEFPQISNKPSGLEKYPLISTNVKYDFARMRYLTHPQRVQIFFSFSLLMQFISKQPIKNESEKNEVLKHNTRFMLEMMFPISYPVIKKMKTASDGNNIMSIFDAVEKEFIYEKFNTYLKLDSKTCTVDEIRFTNTFGTNPIYVKLYDLAKDFLVKRDAAVMVLHGDMKTRLKEFNRTLNAKKKDVLTKITDEIVKIHNSNSKIDVEKLNRDKTDCDAALKDIKTKRTALEELEVEQKDLLRYKGIGSVIVSVKNTIETHLKNHHKGIFPTGRQPVIDVDTTLAKSQETIKALETMIIELEKEKFKTTVPATAKGKKTVATVNINDIDLLIDGYTKLIEYIKKLNLVREAYKISDTDSIIVLFGKIDRLTDLKKEITKLQYEEKEKSDDCDKIKKQIDSGKPVDLKFISKNLPKENDVETALNDSANDATFKSLGINALVQDYILIKRTLIDVIYATVETSVTKFDKEIKDATDNDKNVDTKAFLSDIKTTKDEIKSVYESDANYFSQRNPLAEAFMKLRKICGFAYLITTMHQQQENMNIEREYNINYNIDADLKKGEYLFHKKMTEDLRAYYYPNRQSMEPGIKAIVSVPDTDEIVMDKIVDMFEKHPTEMAAIDLIDLQGKPRYECQVQMVVVGGVITEENSKKIDCSYQDLIIGADVLKEYFNLIVPQFTDLTQEIAEAEKKYNIKYQKIKLEDTSVPGAVNAGPSVGALPTGMPGALPPAPPPKKTSTVVVTDADLDRIIGDMYARDLIKTDDYKNVKVFFETAIDYLDKTKPGAINTIPGTTNTYQKDYQNKKIDAISTIKTMIQKKENEIKPPITLSNTEMQSITRDINTLKKLQTVVNSVDARATTEWLRTISGGKKTRKRRRQYRIKRNTRRPLRYR